MKILHIVFTEDLEPFFVDIKNLKLFLTWVWISTVNWGGFAHGGMKLLRA
jgi:hypothetical protein